MRVGRLVGAQCEPVLSFSAVVAQRRAVLDLFVSSQDSLGLLRIHVPKIINRVGFALRPRSGRSFGTTIP
jgi:hypothetical protein